MARGDGLDLVAPGSLLEELLESDLGIADGADVRRGALLVAFGEGVDDLFLEGLEDVDRVVGEAELLGDAGGVEDGLHVAAARFGEVEGGDSHQVVPLGLQ
ncbi:hypothetical protein D3C87_1474040 [compost metagenome]